MNRPLLSVCIPTYNRANYLKECLDSIVCQFGDNNIYDQIEIIISDNASDDDTEELVAEYQKTYKNIRYFRNKENIGGAKNGMVILQLPLGRYAWLVGDDDIVSGNSIKYLISKIKEKEYSVILMNFDQGEHYNPKIKIYSNSLRLRDDKEYVHSEDFFKGKDFKNFSGINFMSALVYNVDLLKENFYKFDEFLDTVYLQAYIFLILGVNGNILRIAEPLVTWRCGESRRYDKWQKNERQIQNDFNGFIEYSKRLGYVFDENRKTKANRWLTIKGLIFNFFKKYGLVRYARVIYRIPRLIKYYIFKYDKR
jgi:abequosyltransferase